MRASLIYGALVVACGAPPPKVRVLPAVVIEDTCTQDCETLEVDEPEPPPGPVADMVHVPDGWFSMGCDADDWACEEDEKPAHAVWVSSFYIDRDEVTVADYAACSWQGACEKAKTDGSNCNAGHKDRADHPINCVTWFDARSYCKWKGKRLPTEAEWEKAARGTDGRLFPWGEEQATCDRAVMVESGGGGLGCGRDTTWPVGSKERGDSPYGARDMAGNVWEWVHDWFESGFPRGEERDPTGPSKGSERVIKSGSWDDHWYAKAMRGAARSSNGPATNGGHLGFRCAKSN